MVGICYAKWLSEIYGGDIFEYLNDPDLLYQNDPYYKPYYDDPETYERILESINRFDFDNNAGVVPEVRKYFELEFNLQKVDQ